MIRIYMQYKHTQIIFAKPLAIHWLTKCICPHYDWNMYCFNQTQKRIMSQGPFYKPFPHRNSDLVKILFCSNPNTNQMIVKYLHMKGQLYQNIGKSYGIVVFDDEPLEVNVAQLHEAQPPAQLSNTSRVWFIVKYLNTICCHIYHASWILLCLICYFDRHV